MLIYLCEVLILSLADSSVHEFFFLFLSIIDFVTINKCMRTWMEVVEPFAPPSSATLVFVLFFYFYSLIVVSLV